MKCKLLAVLAGVLCVVSCTNLETAQMPREEYIRQYTKTGGVLSREKFADPPIEARPNTFWPILNGYFDLDQITRELEEMKDKGMSGGAYWDTGTTIGAVPAGPAFMGPESVKAIVHTIKEGTRLGLEIGLDSASSWCAGGAWVAPADALQVLYLSQTNVEGPRHYSEVLPFPKVDERCPKGPDGLPVYYKDIAVLAAPAAEVDVSYEELMFELAEGKSHSIVRFVIYNYGQAEAGYNSYSKDFSILASATTRAEEEFKTVLEGTLKPETDPQTFKIVPTRAKYIKLRVHSGYGPKYVELGEFEAYSSSGENVMAAANGGRLLEYSSVHSAEWAWAAAHIHDGVKNGIGGSWCSSGKPRKGVNKEVSSIVDLSGRLDKNGRLTWDVPEGRWTILRFVCSNGGNIHLNSPSPNSHGLVLDTLNPAAIERHFRYIFDKVRTEFGGSFEGTALVYGELGSFEMFANNDWTADFSRMFRQRRGYDPTPYIPILFGWTVENKEITGRFKYDYRKTLSDLVIDNHYRKANEICHEYGLYMRAESGAPAAPVDVLKALGAVDIPQGEAWLNTAIFLSSGFFIRDAAHAAHIYGKKIVDAEIFTSMNWTFNRHWQEGPFEYKQIADRAMIGGMNRLCYHNFTHTPPEGGLPGWAFGAGEHISINDTWWPKSKPFQHDHLSRCCYMLQQGLFVADVCFYYGDQAPNRGPSERGLRQIKPDAEPTLRPGYEYDMTSAEVILTRMDTKDGRIVLPDGMSYELLVLPDREDMDWDVLQKLEKLIKAGATVVGRKPTRTSTLTDYPHRDEKVKRLAHKMWGPCDGEKVKERSYGRGKIIWGRKLRDILQQRGIGPDFSFVSRHENTSLNYIHRRTDNEDIYFIVNHTMRWEDVDCTFRVTGKQPELWLTDDASVRRQVVYDSVPGGTRMRLRLPPAGTVFVVFREPAASGHIVSVSRNGRRIYPAAPEQAGGETDKLEVAPWQSRPYVYQKSPERENPFLEVLPAGKNGMNLLAWQAGVYTLRTGRGKTKDVSVKAVPGPYEITGPWEVRFPEGWGAPKSKVFEKLISWPEDSHKDIKHFSGTATYHKDFTLPASLAGRDLQLVLDLGEVREIADVWLNGKHLGILWKPSYRVDITRAVKPGKNTLKIELTNLWRNRLIGDENLPKEQRRTNTNIRIPKNAPLLKSGLLGPVRLLAGRKMELLPS